MATTPNSIITPQVPKLWTAAIGNGDASLWKLLKDKPSSNLGAGANGSKITGLIATSNDTSARVVQVAVARGETVTTPVASPGLVNWTNHALVAGDQFMITGGTLPTGLTAGVTYWVIAAGLTANVFEVATSAGGSAINFTGSSSGTQTGFSIRLIGAASVAIAAGTDGTTAAANLLAAALMPGLAVDNDGQPYVSLESGDYLAVSAAATVTANKLISVVGYGGNF